FIWDGSHLVQEIDHKTNRTYCYIYSHPNSYEPLAQLVFAKNSKNPTVCYYYHNDQIGVPRELTDEDGKLCWYGEYTGWGKLKDEYALVENIHQPFRLQNQYADEETGLHYNFFRYYEPNVGRFTQLDPIGLEGGNNLYRLAGNVQGWVDPLGLNIVSMAGMQSGAILATGGILSSQSNDFSENINHGNRIGRFDSDGNVISRERVGRFDGNAIHKERVGRFTNAASDNDVSSKCKGQEIRMRHFTNSKGISGIQATNVIIPSDQNKVFAVPAKGKPLSAADFEDKFKLKRGRANHYVDFDTCPGEFIPRPNLINSKAIEFTHDGPLYLNGRNPTYHRNN
ncbi:MAG: RHS repeat-associated core domain-containing protein, partial [[Actinobacillus] rossii]|nr:RHS repeat-associated core domain-containing protein [Gallibacter sp.]MDY4505548.1 RHS repeat-associated core domain-containing protein [[Actinobacillus] rossii]